jgi:hypothetical protein
MSIAPRTLTIEPAVGAHRKVQIIGLVTVAEGRGRVARECE